MWKKLLNIFLKKKHTIVNKQNILHTMIGTKMDFAIPGRWISTNQSTDNDKVAADIIAVHHENESKPGYFLYSALGDGKFNQIGDDTYKSIHESVLINEYLYLGPLLAGSKQKPKIGDIESVKTPEPQAEPQAIQTIEIKPGISAAANQVAKPTLQLQIQNKPVMLQKSFTELFVEKLLSKNDGLLFNNTLQFKTLVNLTQVHETIELMDINATEFVDSLFKNQEFLQTIKDGILEAIVVGAVSTQKHIEEPVIQEEPVKIPEPQPDPRIDELIKSVNDVKTLLIDYNQNHWSNQYHWSNNLDEYKPESEPEIIIKPLVNETINYSEMIKRFMNNDKQK